MRRNDIRQLSVSLPHKEAVLDLADRVSDDARAIGAANTLTRTDDEIVADNTDWIGLVRTLERHGSFEGARVTIVGAGGAARGIAYGLLKMKAAVTIVGRTVSRARQLAADLGARVGSVNDPYDLLVNATPVGMRPETEGIPIDPKTLRSDALVFDSVYRPLETRLLREARARGCRTQDGLDMLVHQAVEQIRLWTHRTPDPAPLRRAAESDLRRDP